MKKIFFNYKKTLKFFGFLKKIFFLIIKNCRFSKSFFLNYKKTFAFAVFSCTLKILRLRGVFNPFIMNNMCGEKPRKRRNNIN
ncbi:MAG: hypothetical protein B6I24_03680 [Bacteroidetes bacterium 4572_128]|nr:MAG: hypothetical protein B6I24_03680 [Bacteroidetes bacterium 4572_128]